MNKGLITKMIVVAILGIAVIAIVIGLMFTPKITDGQPSVDETPVEEVVDETNNTSENEGDKELERMLALVKAIDLTNNMLTVYDIDHNINVNLIIDSTVLFEDEYGTLMVAEQLIPGFLVNIKYDKNTYIPEHVKVAPQVQTIKNLSTFVIDEEKKTIQIGSDIYNYTEELITLDGLDKLGLSQVTVADDVVVRAYKNTIWSIIVENGHGYIVLANYEAFLDGMIEIGNRTSFTIVPDMRIPVTVGIQNVIISKDTMTPFTASVLIAENEDYLIDLKDFQPKIAQVNFRIIQENAILYINDVITEYAQPVQLDFGQYEIKVEAEGFTDWKGILVVEQLNIEQIIDMETEPLYLRIKGPEGAEFYLDGVFKGTFVLDESIDVPILDGGHILTIRKEGYISWSQSVIVEDKGEDYYYTVSELVPIEGQAPTEPAPDGTTPDTTTPTEPIPNP